MLSFISVIIKNAVRLCHSKMSSSLGGGVHPYIRYKGMCSPKGYEFSAILVINRVSVLGSRLHTPIKFFWEYPPPQGLQTWTYCLENFPCVPVQCWKYQYNRWTQISTPTLNWGEGGIFSNI